MNLNNRILALMEASDYVPLNKARLSEELGLSKADRHKLDHAIKQLLEEGRIARIKRDRYVIPKDADLATGIIRFRQSGSAFVIAEDPETGASKGVQIAAQDTWVAMHGDKVVARINDKWSEPSGRGGRPPPRRGFSDEPSGRVIRILERARKVIVGNLQKTKLFHYVVPDDPRLIHDIYVPDPARSKVTPKPKVGDKVVVNLHPWENRHVNPEGEIVERLGSTHEPQAELLSILRKYELSLEFPKAVLKEARSHGDEVSKRHLKGRLDLREVYAFTIDPDDAKDFDDALTVERLGRGERRVGVHIADVGAYVKPGGPMDRDAQKRGNSTYLVGSVVPMLPHELSNGLCSLVENEDRLTKSVFLTYDAKGRLQSTDFASSVIRSNKRLTYKQAYTLLKEDDIEKARRLPLPPSHQTGATGRPLGELGDKELRRLQASIRDLWSIASRLRQARMKNGSLDLDMEETKIFVDEDGYADRLEKVVNDESHQLIEEFMLAANETVAKALREAKLPAIYRTHDDPDEEKLQDLREYMATFGVEAGDLANRKEMCRLLRILASHPQSHLLKTQVLRSLKKACYRSSPDGHYGLAKRDYCHFTSPIRRYADLVTHRVTDFYLVKFLGKPPLAGKLPRYDAAKAKALGEHLSLTEVNSVEAERESVKVKLLEFFERELAKSRRTAFAAVILETRNHGMFVELTESGAFGLVHVSTLKDDLYRLDGSGTALVGRRYKRAYKTGQKIEVEVERVDRFKRQVDFRLKRSQTSDTTTGAAKKARRPRRRRSRRKNPKP